MPLQQIQTCIQTCEQVANRLRTIANQVPDQRSRYMLTEAARHTEECIHGCNMASMLEQGQAPRYQ